MQYAIVHPPHLQAVKKSYLVLNTPNEGKKRLGCISCVNGKIRLVNYNSVLPPVCFIGGYSGTEKTAAENRQVSKGKFGDGMKSAVSVLLKKAKEITIITRGGFQYEFSYATRSTLSQRAEAAQTLHYKVISPPSVYKSSSDDFDATTDTLVLIDLSPKVLAQNPFVLDMTRYLFLDKSHTFGGRLVKEPPKSPFQIIGTAERGGFANKPGRIYVKGMLAVNNGDRWGSRSGPHFSYNFRGYDAMSRDRLDTMAEKEKKRWIAAAWAYFLRGSELSPGWHEDVCEKLFDVLSNNGECLECVAIKESCECLSLSGGRNNATDGDTIKRYLVKHFFRRFPDALPCTQAAEQSRRTIKKLGIEVVTVSAGRMFFLTSRVGNSQAGSVG